MLVKVQNDQGEMEPDDPQVRKEDKSEREKNVIKTMVPNVSVRGPSSLDIIILLSSAVQVSYMISAWARMCKIIGPGFVQYLPVVMGPLIQAASLKPEIAFVDCEFIL